MSGRRVHQDKRRRNLRPLEEFGHETVAPTYTPLTADLVDKTQWIRPKNSLKEILITGHSGLDAVIIAS